MSVEDRGVIDFFATRREVDRILVGISDHLDWSSPIDHLHKLQENMNDYAAFIESGQVWERASETASRAVPPGSVPVELKVFLLHEPPALFLEFLDRAREAFAALPITVSYEVKSG